MNGYGRLSRLKADLAGVGNTFVMDAALVAIRDEVSREFDRETRRTFYTSVGTRYYSGGGRELLLFGDDVISITSVKLADEWITPTAFENTLVTATDRVLWPRNAAAKGQPYRGIYLNPRGQYGAFPLGADNIEVVGRFGYSETWQTTGLTGTLADTTDTSLTASATASAIVDVGDMLQIESEQLEVTAVDTLTLTVVRACNGTTAVAHTAAAFTIRRYPEDIENAVKERAAGRRWDSQGGYEAGVTFMGDAQGAAGATTGRALYARWRNTVGAYTNPAAVIV